MSKEDAVQQLIDLMSKEAQTRATQTIKSIEDEAKLTATKKAKKVVIETIQRTAAETAIENCVSIFNIESDDIKGKINKRSAERFAKQIEIKEQTKFVSLTEQVGVEANIQDDYGSDIINRL